MNIKRIVGIVLLIIGIVCIIFSQYIKYRLNEGVAKIARAEEKISEADSHLPLRPIARERHAHATDSAEEKIDAGRTLISRYETIASILQIGGIILIIVGVGATVLCRKKLS